MNEEKHPLENHDQEEHLHELHEEHSEHGSCHELLSTLCDYVDGTLSEELCAEVDRHMKDCPRCRIVVNTTRKTIELYQEEADEESLPADVHDRLFIRLNLDDYLNK